MSSSKINICVSLGMLAAVCQCMSGCFYFTRTLWASNPHYRQDDTVCHVASATLAFSSGADHKVLRAILSMASEGRAAQDAWALSTFTAQRLHPLFFSTDGQAALLHASAAYAHVTPTFADDYCLKFSREDLRRIGELRDTIKLEMVFSITNGYHGLGADKPVTFDESFGTESYRVQDGTLHILLDLIASRLETTVVPTTDVIVSAPILEATSSVVQPRIHHGILSTSWRVLLTPAAFIVGDVALFPLSIGMEYLDRRLEGPFSLNYAP